jgi:hypothetical protein
VTASRTTVVAIAAVVVAVLSLGGWWMWYPRGGVTTTVQQEPVSVLIANFENKANEPIFDGLAASHGHERRRRRDVNVVAKEGNSALLEHRQVWRVELQLFAVKGAPTWARQRILRG